MCCPSVSCCSLEPTVDQKDMIFLSRLSTTFHRNSKSLSSVKIKNIPALGYNKVCNDTDMDVIKIKIYSLLLSGQQGFMEIDCQKSIELKETASHSLNTQHISILDIFDVRIYLPWGFNFVYCFDGDAGDYSVGGILN